MTVFIDNGNVCTGENDSKGEEPLVTVSGTVKSKTEVMLKTTRVLAQRQESEYENPHAYFLPHHPVIKNGRGTTKCRVVFDASSKDKDNEFCLNDYQEEGPNTIPNIFDVMVNFRSQPVGLTADIQSAFL